MGLLLFRHRSAMHSRMLNSHLKPQEAEETQAILAAILDSTDDAIIGQTTAGTISSWNPAAVALFGYGPREVIGKPLTILAAPDRTDEVSRICSRVRAGEPVRSVETVFVGKRGQRIDVAVTCTTVRNRIGRSTQAVAIVRDISRRKKGIDTRLQRDRELLALHRLSEIILSRRSLDSSYRDIVQEISSATGFPFATIAIYDQARQKIIFKGTRGPSPHSGRIQQEVPFDSTLSSVVIRTGKPLIETHVLDHPEYRNKALRWGRAQTFVGYPMKVGERVIGSLNVAHTESIDISGETARWIESLANFVAVLGERKRAEEELRSSREQLRELSRHIQSAIEDERLRIAREIHDKLGQELSLLQLEVGLIREQLPKDKRALRGKTASMMKLIDSTIRSVQRISTDLRPTLLDNLGLGAAIEWASKEFQKRTKIHCRVDVDPSDLKLDPDRSTALFRILQEALTNVLRHARASRVHVRLTRHEETVTLSVRDNGVGIAAARITDSKSVGLTGIRERVLPWSGKVSITGKPGKGTEVIITVPAGS